MPKLIDITGKAISGEWGQEDLEGEGIPVLRTTNFTNEGVIRYDDVVTRHITKKNIADKMLRKGDIIIEKSGGSDKQPVGRVVYFEGEENKFLFNNFTGLLRVKDTKKWMPRYVFYSLYGNYINGGTKAFENRTTGLHNLQTDSYVMATEVRDVTLDEQAQIVNQLDCVLELIAKHRKQFAFLDVLVKSRFIELFGDPKVNPFGWNTTIVGDVIASCEAGWSGNGTQRERKDGEIAVLKVSAVTKGYFIPEESKVLDDQDNIKKYVYPQAGDLLFSRANTREMVGATAVITQDYPEHILPDKLWKIRFLDKANVWYMKYVLSSESIRSIFSSVSTGTSGSMFNVSMDKFKSIRIPLPPLDRQQRFAAFVAEVDKSKLAVQQGLQELETLKKSLMQQYFG
jgi:type I restriction enzyme, S subunit